MNLGGRTPWICSAARRVVVSNPVTAGLPVALTVTSVSRGVDWAGGGPGDKVFLSVKNASAISNVEIF